MGPCLGSFYGEIVASRIVFLQTRVLSTVVGPGNVKVQFTGLSLGLSAIRWYCWCCCCCCC
jgi:hypothetical protein